MGDSTEQINNNLEPSNWEDVHRFNKDTQDLWWLTEKVVDGKKKTQLENALEKGRSFKKLELLAPIKWLTPENYQTYVRRVVEIIQKFKDEKGHLDRITDETFEELNEEYELIKNPSTSRKGRRKPHTVFAVHKKELKVKRGDAWSELKEYAKKSKGDIQIDLPGYGLIYLKIDKDIQTGNLSYKETAFINSKDGFPITRKAFDAAWDS
jgi:hypothetical protein